MKKTVLITTLIIFSLKTNAQNFGIMPELGASWKANRGHDAEKRSPGLFYGLGMYYTTKIGGI
jgi:hypothetical protein